jgi:hypothetical protein
MHCCRTHYRLVLALGVLGAGLLAGCARGKPSASAHPSATLLIDTTTYTRMVAESVFTDTALFRQVCAEADSGLTSRTAGKCTPRDQGGLGRRPRPPRR